MAELKGTLVASRIVPSDSQDTYATHEALYGKGGHRSVSSIAERDAIPVDRREVGMSVYVSYVDELAGSGKYFLKGGITNSHWELEESNSGINQATLEELDKKVDKEEGKQLSQENFTTAFMQKLSQLDNNFKGYFLTEEQIADAVENPAMGNYVLVKLNDSSTVFFYDGTEWKDTGSSSLGDMMAVIYDPSGVAGDVFDVDNMVESLTRKFMTAVERAKLEGIEAGAQVNTVNKVNNKTGNVVLDKSDIGLDKVNNTADIEKIVAEANKTRGELTLVVNGTETKFNGSENKTIQVEASGSGGGSGDYNDLTNKPNFKTINNQFIVGTGNLDIKSELYNYGFNLKGIYSNVAELREDEGNPIHKDTDIWMTKESLDFVFVNDEPVYIAPDGSDETGDGSYDNPYRTFTNIPKNSLIKLKAGQYRGSDYGYFSLSYGKVHGLFKGLMSGEATSDTRPNNPNVKEIPKDYKAKLVALNSTFTRMETFSVITKESDDAVVEIIDDVGTATEAKPWFRFYGATTDLWIFKDLKFIREVVLTSTNTNSTIALMESANPKAFVVEDCVFECSGGRYGYNYSTSSYILLNRCRFDNGTIAHHGPAVVLNNDSMDIYRDAINIVPTALYIYYANQSKFIPFNLPKTVDSDPYPVKFEGLSEIPSPKGQDGTVAFSDLTEEQVEELTRNKNIRVRISKNLLYYNKNNNTSYLDIQSSQKVNLKSVNIKTTEDEEYLLPLTPVSVEPTEIGECRYANIDHDTDIFKDGSCIAFFPFKENLRSKDGVYNMVNVDDTPLPFTTSEAYIKNETIPVFDSLGTALSAKASPSIPLTNTSSISFYVFVATDQNDTHFQILSLGGIGFRVSINLLFITSAVSDLYALKKTDGSNHSYPYGSWMHVVINKKTNNTADVYLNGVKTALASKTATAWAFEDTNFYIGHHSSTVKAFNNKLSDVRIFNRNLTQAEINSLRDRVRKNALELYHGSGEPLEEAKVINTTLNLDIPSFTDNATALNFGLEKDDLYLSGSNVLSTVQ
jgi:hypothetical protein